MNVTAYDANQHYPYKAEKFNLTMIKRIQQAGMALKWSNPKFFVTHEKALLLDQSPLIIFTGNFTRNDFRQQRNFAFIDYNTSDIKQFSKVMYADWHRKQLHSLQKTNLIWSPNNSQKRIIEFIKGAKTSLLVYNQEISDQQLIKALLEAEEKTKHVQVIVPLKTVATYCESLKELSDHHIAVKLDGELYVHAKAMLADYHHKDMKVFLGSTNFTHTALNANRELAVVDHSTQLAGSMRATFLHDWYVSDNFQGICH